MDSPKLYTPADKDLTANVADPVLFQTEATIEGVIVALEQRASARPTTLQAADF